MTNTRTRVEPLHCPEGAGPTIHPLQIVDHRIGDEACAMSARALHRALGTHRDFTSWFKAQVKRAGRDLGSLRRHREAIERTAAPLRALVQPLLTGLEDLS